MIGEDEIDAILAKGNIGGKRDEKRYRYYIYDGLYVVKRDTACENFYRLESHDGEKQITINNNVDTKSA